MTIPKPTRQMLAEFDGLGFETKKRGRHLALEHEGRVVVVFSGTRVDPRDILNTRAQIRRWIRTHLQPNGVQ